VRKYLGPDFRSEDEMTTKTLFGCATLIYLCGSCSLPAQSGAKKATGPAADPAGKDQIEELVLANRILSNNGVLDAYGHVSVRSTRNPNHFFLAQHIPSATVTAKDIIEYDLDSKPVYDTPMIGYSERFIHGEIYRARADVKAVVHGHAPEIVSFSITPVPLQPVAHMAAFIAGGVPVFEIRTATKDGEMLIRSNELGRALAKTLGNRPAALMRGHGVVVVADSLHVVAGRAYYMNLNARELMQALLLAPGKVTYLQPNEMEKMAAQDGYERAWELWKQAASQTRSAATSLP
jgi:ribulose-5-phosphate 4-epimerase/fuculose-1-phosphate aldolase